MSTETRSVLKLLVDQHAAASAHADKTRTRISEIGTRIGDNAAVLGRDDLRELAAGLVKAIADLVHAEDYARECRELVVLAHEENGWELPAALAVPTPIEVAARAAAEQARTIQNGGEPPAWPVNIADQIQANLGKQVIVRLVGGRNRFRKGTLRSNGSGGIELETELDPIHLDISSIVDIREDAPEPDDAGVDDADTRHDAEAQP